MKNLFSSFSEKNTKFVFQNKAPEKQQETPEANINLLLDLQTENPDKAVTVVRKLLNQVKNLKKIHDTYQTNPNTNDLYQGKLEHVLYQSTPIDLVDKREGSSEGSFRGTLEKITITPDPKDESKSFEINILRDNFKGDQHVVSKRNDLYIGNKEEQILAINITTKASQKNVSPDFIKKYVLSSINLGLNIPDEMTKASTKEMFSEKITQRWGGKFIYAENNPQIEWNAKRKTDNQNYILNENFANLMNKNDAENPNLYANTKEFQRFLDSQAILITELPKKMATNEQLELLNKTLEIQTNEIKKAEAEVNKKLKEQKAKENTEKEAKQKTEESTAMKKIESGNF